MGTLSPTVANLALIFVREARREYASYLESCEADRANGYRAHYCEHGTDRWTDYDNICGACEDSHTHAYGLDIYRDALREAQRVWDEAHAMISLAVEAEKLSEKLPGIITVDFAALSLAYREMMRLPAPITVDA